MRARFTCLFENAKIHLYTWLIAIASRHHHSLLSILVRRGTEERKLKNTAQRRKKEQKNGIPCECAILKTHFEKKQDEATIAVNKNHQLRVVQEREKKNISQTKGKYRREKKENKTRINFGRFKKVFREWMKGNENKDETTQFLHIARKFMATEREEKKAENDCAHTHTWKTKRTKCIYHDFFAHIHKLWGMLRKQKVNRFFFIALSVEFKKKNQSWKG